jgi:hypothetical protein
MLKIRVEPATVPAHQQTNRPIAGHRSYRRQGGTMMRTPLLLLCAVGAALLVTGPASGGEPAPAEGSFFEKSLHSTNRGIEFIYSKEHGGLERLTGLSASEVGCVKAKCHVRTCDTCHRKDVAGKAAYTLDPAVAQAACEACHGVPEGADVHREKGMKCMGCHTTREVHGDGVAYDTYMRPGVLDARCERCHSEIGKSVSHTVHRGKLDCSTCHVRELTTCLNCHIDTRIKEGKGAQIELKGMFFLVNHDGRVTLANFLSYVYQNRTMLTFAPTFPHSIARDGRKCPDCHGSQIVRDIGAGSFVPVRWENGRVTNVRGVIPVLGGMKWNIPYLNYDNGKWVPIDNPGEPLLNYSGFCTPLTREQFAKLEKAPGSGGGE